MPLDRQLGSTDEPRRLFAEGLIYKLGDWVFVNEWIAHHGLELPAEWLADAIENTAVTQERIDNYVSVVEGRNREAVRFNPPHDVISNGEWTYQSVKGKAPLCINADVRAFFERITPGSRWFMARTSVVETEDGIVFARVHPELGVRCVVAGCDPRLDI